MRIKATSRNKKALYAIVIVLLIIMLVAASLFLYYSVNIKKYGAYFLELERRETLEITNHHNGNLLSIDFSHLFLSRNQLVFFESPSDIDKLIMLIYEEDNSYVVSNYEYNYIVIHHPSGSYYQLKRYGEMQDSGISGMPFSITASSKLIMSSELEDRGFSYQVPLPIEHFAGIRDSYYTGNTLDTIYEGVDYVLNCSFDTLVEFYKGHKYIDIEFTGESFILTNTADNLGYARTTVTYTAGSPFNHVRYNTIRDAAYWEAYNNEHNKQ